MPLVFCSATSADRPRRSVSAVFLARRSVPQFVQVFGFGKNERHWLGKLRATRRVPRLAAQSSVYEWYSSCKPVSRVGCHANTGSGFALRLALVLDRKS